MLNHSIDLGLFCCGRLLGKQIKVFDLFWGFVVFI